MFLLSKGPRYFYDAAAIREPVVSDRAPSRRAKASGAGHVALRPNGSAYDGTETSRNKRSVWTVASQPYTEAHFAVFPPALVEPCVLAGAPERCCEVCGAPWERLTESERVADRPSRVQGRDPSNEQAGEAHGPDGRSGNRHRLRVTTAGFAPSCAHDGPAVPGVVLDPFSGAGTTGLVAVRNGREYVGVELNPEYARLARERIATDIRLGHRAPQRVPEPEGQGGLF